MVEAVYKVDEDFVYGDVVGIWIADTSEYEKLKGKRVFLGEVAGKHSEVELTINDRTVTKVSEDPAVIAMIRANNLEIGTNLFAEFDPDQYDDENEDEDEDY